MTLLGSREHYGASNCTPNERKSCVIVIYVKCAIVPEKVTANCHLDKSKLQTCNFFLRRDFSNIPTEQGLVRVTSLSTSKPVNGLFPYIALTSMFCLTDGAAMTLFKGRIRLGKTQERL